MKLKELMEKYGEQEVLCWAERADESLEWVNIKLEPPKPKTVWELKERDAIFTLNCDGFIEDDNWYDSLDDERDNGNIFLTYEDAENERERRKVETLLLKYGGRRWFKAGKENWFITFDHSVCLCFFKYTIIDTRQGMIYFDTEEKLKKAVEQIGEDRIKQALFEVR